MSKTVNPRLKAAVARYGRIDRVDSELMPKHPLNLAAQLKAPVLGLYGGQDQGIPLDDIEVMRDAIRKAGGKSELKFFSRIAER